MTKILAQAGMSLADIYNIVGSIAGVEELESRGVSLVHEMGATVFSERLIGTVLRGTTGDILQNASWDITITPPGGFYRVLGVQVITDNGARPDRAQVSLRSVNSGRELLMFGWDDTVGTLLNIRMVDNGAAVANFAQLIQGPGGPPATMPTLGIGVSTRGAERVGDEIVFRGLANGFGAGNVEVIALIYVASLFTPASRPFASIGLPLPGW